MNRRFQRRHSCNPPSGYGFRRKPLANAAAGWQNRPKVKNMAKTAKQSNDIRDALKPHLARLVEIRRHIHQNPEIGYEEQATTALVERELTAAGVEVLRTGKSGLLGTIRGAKPGPTVALRADMDALAMVEQTGLPYSAKGEYAHACGHDGHTTMLLGAALVLAQRRQKLAGNVRLIFQPAEEGGFGGRYMCEHGAMDGVSAVFGLHAQPGVPIGSIAVKPGPMSAFGDRVFVSIRGKGGHGARPQSTIDPVLAAAQVIVGCQSIVSRSIDPGEQAVISFCTVHAGTATNVIPDTAEVSGTVRSLNEETRALLQRRIREVCAGVAKATGAKIRVTWRPGYPSVVNDPAMVDLVSQVATEQLGKDKVLPLARASTGAEDFSYYQQIAPGCFFRLGIAEPGQPVHSLHSSSFDFNDKAISFGVSMLAGAAMKFLAK